MREGGEATVALPADHGTGGRNQQAVVAAITALLQIDGGWPAGLLLASIGTDGEDGPTQAAGGLADADVVGALDRQGSDPLRTLIRALDRALDRCDALPLLASASRRQRRCLATHQTRVYPPSSTHNRKTTKTKM
jgi:hypothetical protein